VFTLGDIAMSKKQHYFIAGIEEKQKPGPLRIYNFPLNGEFWEVEAHSAEVRRVRVAPTDKHVFSVGADGCLIVYELRGQQANQKVKKKISA